MMVKWANDCLLQANDGEMLVNDGEMLVNNGEMLVNDGEMVVNDGEMSVWSCIHFIIRSFDHHWEVAPTVQDMSIFLTGIQGS